MLFLKDLLHVGDLCFADLPLLLMILDYLLLHEAADFSQVEDGLITLIVEVFHAADHVKGFFVREHLTSQLLFFFQLEHAAVG